MRISRPLEFCEVRAHCSVVRVWQPVFIAVALPLMEVFMHLPHIVKQVTKTNTIRLITELILIGFHGLSHITPLTPNEWVGPTRHLAMTLIMSVQCDVSIIPQFRIKRQGKMNILALSNKAGIHPRPRGTRTYCPETW